MQEKNLSQKELFNSRLAVSEKICTPGYILQLLNYKQVILPVFALKLNFETEATGKHTK